MSNKESSQKGGSSQSLLATERAEEDLKRASTALSEW
jgi:hypothetical protein